MIEQFFRVMKTQGFKIEDSQLQLAARLEKLVAIAAKAAAIVLQLVQDRSGGDPHPASLAVSPQEINTLAALESRFKGKTKLQSNPHPKASLAWAAWIIAKLSDWNGYASSKPPGPITFFNGLKYCADGWALRDRYMPQSFGREMFHWIICFWSRTKSSDQRAEPSRWPGSVRACLQVGGSRAQHRP